MNYQKIIDISMTLDKATFNYPGTTKLSINTSLSETSKSVLSTITMSSHTGTHIDAPNHAIKGASGIDSFKLEVFVGKCRVLDLTSVKTSISVKDLKLKSIKKHERILFKTQNSIEGFVNMFPKFIFLSSDASFYLANQQVALVGIDSLSIKQRGSLDNTPHTALLSSKIPILEGLDLSQVKEGEYFLISLPLKLTGLNGSPVRAILLS